MPKKLRIVAKLPPLHPGEVLREEFLLPMKLSPYAVAKACGVPRSRIERIAREESGITADTALRLGRYFGIEPQFWLNLQTATTLRRPGLQSSRRSTIFPCTVRERRDTKHRYPRPVMRGLGQAWPAHPSCQRASSLGRLHRKTAISDVRT